MGFTPEQIKGRIKSVAKQNNADAKLVYLKLSEMHPFHTFRPHPFKVRDDAKMQETVASIKANGVMVI